VSDALTEPGEWFESEIRQEQAQCVFAGTLRASRIDPGDFACAGPERQLPADVRVAVSTVLRSAGSCSAIWFRWNGEAGYRLLLCAGSVQFEVARPDGARMLAKSVLRRPIAFGQGVDVRIDVRGDSATAVLDGVAVQRARLTEGDLGAGEVLLGISVRATTDRPPFAVAFADVDIRALGR
jgi:hypothetical protein